MHEMYLEKQTNVLMDSDAPEGTELWILKNTLTGVDQRFWMKYGFVEQIEEELNKQKIFVRYL